LNVIRKSVLGEISFVDLGADGQTSASVAASARNQQMEQANMDESTQTGQATTSGQAIAAAPNLSATRAADNGYTGPTAEEIRARPWRSPTGLPASGDLRGAVPRDRSPGDP